MFYVFGVVFHLRASVTFLADDVYDDEFCSLFDENIWFFFLILSTSILMFISTFTFTSISIFISTPTLPLFLFFLLLSPLLLLFLLSSSLGQVWTRS